MKSKEKRVYADRADYLKKAVSKRRKNLLEKAREYKGGQCIICGYKKCSRALSFHHIDPKKKSFGIASQGITRSWEKLQKELDKCVLVCSNCHMEIHEKVTQLPKEILG